ncbi:MAG: methyltransferase [Bacteriovorax sp.]
MKCDFFQNAHCLSCELLDKSYAETLLLKEAHLKNLFPDEIPKFKSSVTLEAGATGSRSKAKFAVFSHNNEITFGFYNKEGIPKELETCPLHAQGINELLPHLKDILKRYQIIPYDLKTKTGELKYLLVSKSENEFLLRFVLRSKESLDRLKKAVKEFRALSFNIKVVTANIQPVHQAILEGDEEILLTDDSVIIHQFDEFKLALGARSFFQVTPEIALKLYGTLADEVSRDRPVSLIDLYCGVGAFSFYASRWCEDISGVEISKEAIDCALMSAEINQRPIDFRAMDVEEFLKKSPKKFEAVLINPPRRGLNKAIIKSILEIDPLYIYYSSCNAVSLRRDHEDLKERYDIKSLRLFDMFPYTAHYETLMCLKRK